MRVFITGISGFIGSGLVEYLKHEKGISIFGHSRDFEKTSQKFKGSRVTLVPTYSAQIFDELGIDSVIHLAGIAHDLSNKYKQEDYHKVNFEGTVAIFDAFAKSSASKFIFLSSIKAAVDSSSSVVTEDVTPHPTSPYGQSKRMAEKYIQEYNLPESKRAYIFRPVMIHGKGNKGNLNTLFKYLRSGLPYIFGAYKNSRSFLSADNLHFILRRFLENDYPSGTYHLADDKPLSTIELIRIISESLGRKPRIWNIPTGMMDPMSRLTSLLGLPLESMKQKLTESLVVSNEKLKSVLHEPLPLDVRTGLLNTLRTFNEQ